MHPITQKIKGAIAKVQRSGLPVTLSTVRANVAWDDFTLREEREILEAALNRKISRELKREGLIIGDELTHERFRFWNSTRTQIKVQWQIERDNRQHVEANEKARRMVLDLLETKERELGYEPYAGLFEDDIRRIYSMHGLEAPH